MNLKEAIKERGMTMRFIEKEAKIPDRTLSQFNAGVKGLAGEHVANLNTVLKRYGIKYKVVTN